jgi:alpha-tubulin suppressor-like RCC1 family protein
MAITSDGNIWAWGSNSDGELGIGTVRGAWEQGSDHRGETLSAWLYPIQLMEYVTGGIPSY